MTITFLNPGAFVLIPVVAILSIFVLWRIRSHHQTLRNLGDLTLLRQLISGPRATRGLWRTGLWAFAVTNLVIALARPAWGINMDVVEFQGVSVVGVLDVSNSMLAQDMLPSRLERAKLTLHDLFNGLQGNELGLVLFAGRAIVQFPLTNDAYTANAFLNAASTDSITQQGTAFQEALRTTLNLFDEKSPAARVIVLISDGEDHEGDFEPELDAAVSAGVTIFTIGFGDATGVPIPVLGSDGQVVTYKADNAGNLILSHLDEATLQRIAERTGGIYQHASSSGVEIDNLIHLINAKETGTLDSRSETHSIERFGIFVLLAIIALTLEILTPNARKAAA